MKKIHKKILGFLSLGIVVAVTFVAAAIPEPEVYAVSGNTVEDKVVVRVVGNKPNIEITGPVDDSITNSPDQTISFEYQDVDKITITIIYTSPDGDVHTYYLDPIIADYAPYGEYSVPLDLSSDGYGYGHYLIKVEGEGFEDGVLGTDSVEFEYYPAIVTIDRDAGSTDPDSKDDDGRYKIDIDYGDNVDDVTGATITINNNENGDLVKQIEITPFPVDSYTLVLSDYGLEPGIYTINVRINYLYNGAVYYKTYSYVVYFRVDSMGVPYTADTGGFLGTLNIAKSDYLITGLIIFGMVGAGGAVFIAKRTSKTPRKKR